jgi:hypothetical protein
LVLHRVLGIRSQHCSFRNQKATPTADIHLIYLLGGLLGSVQRNDQLGLIPNGSAQISCAIIEIVSLHCS